MSDHRTVWTTGDEKRFLEEMASRGKLHVIDGWLAGAAMRSDWGLMERDELTKYARTLLGRI